MRSHRIGWIGWFAATLAFFLVDARSAFAEEPAVLEAVWKQQRVSFQYRGYSTFYNCSALREKMRRILTGLGARESLRIHAYACDDVSGNARFDITLESPIPATDENVRMLTTYTTHEQLVARARGHELPEAVNLERFPATWQTISFARDRSMRLDRGDCELVEQLRKSLLPQLSVQIVHDNVRCSPFGPLRPPSLTVLALVAEKPDAL